MLPIEALQQRVKQSELGQEWIDNPLLNQDIWSVEELDYSEEESKITGIRNIYFEKFSLPWLKLLAKLTAKATIRERSSLSLVVVRVGYLKQLDNFLMLGGYTQPQALTDSLLQKFIAQKATNNRRATIAYVAKLWSEEQWLKVPYIPQIYKKPTPKIETIPEEVLYQIYEKFDLFPPPLERLFRLQLVLGCRIREVLTLPRRCIKREGSQWFLLRWIAKQKHWRFKQIHPSVAELVIEQQRFLDAQFGSDSEFDKLFCKTFPLPGKKRFQAEFIYMPEFISTVVIGLWLKDFSQEADLKDKHGRQFVLKSHMFRRTKASIMAHCEAEDEYIAVVLGHGSLDMLPHYRQRSLERLEKEAKVKGYVDMYGRVSSFKPRKRRYEKLTELLKVTTSLGECHRPTMLGDCQYRYACLSCDHHRVTEEDKPKLEVDFQRLKQDLKEAQIAGQERKITEINRLLKWLEARLQGLEKLQNTKY